MSLMANTHQHPDTLVLINLAYSSPTGIIRLVGSEMEVTQEAVPGLSVIVGTGRAFIEERAAQVRAAATPADITVPTGGNPGDTRRIDNVLLTRGGTGVNIQEGTESGTPSAPSLPANSMLLATLTLRNGMSSIKDTDDSTNGFITDSRSYV